MSGCDIHIPETLLHFIWKTQRFSFFDLKTTAGHHIDILDFGRHNHDAGPDFLDGRIRIGDTVWVGHIELHVDASDWHNHRHSEDPAYENVILHVVWNHNSEVHTGNGRQLPALEIKNHVNAGMLTRYHLLNSSLDWIACERMHLPGRIRNYPSFLRHLTASRLKRKSGDIIKLLQKHTMDWEYILMLCLFRHIGSGVNAPAFTQLAEITPYKLVNRYSSNQYQLEALLLGQAGMISGQDAYMNKLRREYNHLRVKHDLSPMAGHEWRFSRMRPSNFPSLRIAELAAIYNKTTALFATTLQNFLPHKLHGLLTVECSGYWKNHYTPAKFSRPSIKRIGKSTADVLIINVFVPVIFTYAYITGQKELMERSIAVLKSLTPEANNILRKWKEIGMKARNAAESQALLELKNEYCSNLRCMECEIGQDILTL